eukprot:18239-Rhodomonas_salina.1
MCCRQALQLRTLRGESGACPGAVLIAKIDYPPFHGRFSLTYDSFLLGVPVGRQGFPSTGIHDWLALAVLGIPIWPRAGVVLKLESRKREPASVTDPSTVQCEVR